MRPTTPSRLTTPLLRLSHSHPFHRTPPLSTFNPSPSRAIHLTPRAYAQESYGNSSNPAPSPNKGSPSETHPSSEQTESREHPGPKSPAEGGKGGEVGKGEGGGGKGGAKAQPKILSEGDDEKGGKGKGEEVERHNEEMDKRHDRPQEKEGQGDDRVGKGFWKGTGGADRDP